MEEDDGEVEDDDDDDDEEEGEDDEIEEYIEMKPGRYTGLNVVNSTYG